MIPLGLEPQVHNLPAPGPQCCWASYQFHAEDGLTRFLLQISCPRPARCPQPPPPRRVNGIKGIIGWTQGIERTGTYKGFVLDPSPMVI